MSQLYYRRTDSSSYRDRIPLRIVRSESELSSLEKAYLGTVEKGDYGSVKQALEVGMDGRIGVCVCAHACVRVSFRWIDGQHLRLKVDVRNNFFKRVQISLPSMLVIKLTMIIIVIWNFHYHPFPIIVTPSLSYHIVVPSP